MSISLKISIFVNCLKPCNSVKKCICCWSNDIPSAITVGIFNNSERIATFYGMHKISILREMHLFYGITQFGQDWSNRKVLRFLLFENWYRFENSNTQNTDLKFKLLCNRSLLFLFIQHYSHALIDAEHALKLNKQSVKAKFRCITALNGIGQYLKAMQLLKSVNRKTIESSSIRKQFVILDREIIIKYRESMGILQNEGKDRVDFALYSAFSDHSKWANVSDFIGPICVHYIGPKKGRGIVATKNIKRGDIILIEKVFAKGMYKNGKQKV